ncbi:MAG: hypothetical protein PG981_001470 [Wolbachia endosymbiont of Ctenocephalides orientis wCori]|nr:MAG: hypothetical protein PG981_001470 [Wolbachia endosymbiont of Ctenocephalides orientis wCori]
MLLSIGTGRLSNPIKYINSKRFGKIAWVKPLLNVIFGSSLDVVNYQLKNIIDDQYLRIQSQLRVASPDLDNAGTKNIKLLQQEAQVVIECNQEGIDKFCTIVS